MNRIHEASNLYRQLRNVEKGEILFLVTHKLVDQYKMVSYENILTRNIIKTVQVVVINEK